MAVAQVRAFLFAVMLALAACGGREVSLTYEGGRVFARGWSGPAPAGGWESVLSVRASEDPSAPAMLGDYAESGGVITFTPRFPPAPGVMLHAVFHVNQSSLEAVFGESIVAAGPGASVVAIHPAADAWPENTLRMYLHFSAPMAAGEAYAHITVIDEQGRAIDKPFVEIEPELWDPSGTRLTVLFDPGRIKRGLVDNRESGPPLLDGRTVKISIDPFWRDASGAALASAFSRTVRVTEAMRMPVQVTDWDVDEPTTARSDLVIRFGRPMDHALAARAISVLRGGAPVDGEVRLENAESSWRFTPTAPWQPGEHLIVVDGIIEDVAGNRPGKAFDVDTADQRQSTEALPVTTLSFMAPKG